MTRPIVRVDGCLLFPDGTSRPATDDENRRMNAGEEVLIDPRSGHRTRLVGDEYPPHEHVTRQEEHEWQ